MNFVAKHILDFVLKWMQSAMNRFGVECQSDLLIDNILNRNLTPSTMDHGLHMSGKEMMNDTKNTYFFIDKNNIEILLLLIESHKSDRRLWDDGKIKTTAQSHNFQIRSNFQ